MTALTLRDYQLDGLDRSEKATDRGVRRQLWHAATGLGKTVMFCAKAERVGGRSLILAHRDELVSQAAAKVREVWPAASVGIVKAESDDVTADVVVASVQTLSRDRRLARLLRPMSGESMLLRADPFSLVVVDEAHHAAADTYRKILAALRCGEPDGPLLVGVTATPDRGDGKGLDDLFDEIVFSYDILWGIRAGYLSDLRGTQVRLDTFDIGKVRTRRGDYDQGQAGSMLEDAGAPEHIVAAWKQHAAGRKTLVFTPTVELARLTAERFNGGGVPTGMVYAGTPLEERRAMLRRFHDDDLTVITNCGVLTEGYDEPGVSCIVVARPTKSRALYVQMVGRGTRRYPGKNDCLVLDVVGVTDSHDLVTIPSLFGVDPKDIKKGASILEAVAAQEQREIRAGRMVAKDVELFNRLREQKLAWVPVRGDYCLALGSDTVVLVRGDDDGETDPLWTSKVVSEANGQKPTVRVLMADVSLELAQGVGEDYARKNGRLHLMSSDADWRKRPPSERQLAAAAKWRIRVDPSWTAGQLSEAIDAKATDTRLRKVKTP